MFHYHNLARVQEDSEHVRRVYQPHVLAPCTAVLQKGLHTQAAYGICDLFVLSRQVN
jgi:hypothetical protein